MDTDLAVYHNSNMQFLGTCTIQHVSPVHGKTYDTKFSIANHNGSMLLSAKTHLHAAGTATSSSH